MQYFAPTRLLEFFGSKRGLLIAYRTVFWRLFRDYVHGLNLRGTKASALKNVTKLYYLTGYIFDGNL